MKKQIFRGQSLVEFALVFPMVLYMLFGFLDLGRAVFYYSSLSNSVREGTRAGIVNHVYLADAQSGADKGKSVMTSNPICPMITDENVALTEDTIRCIVYRYGFALSDSLNPASDGNIAINVILDVNGFFEKVSITGNYCYVPLTPGIKFIINTTCGGEKGFPITAQSTMFVTPNAK